MFEAILLLGLAALSVALLRTARRLAVLEKRVAWLTPRHVPDANLVAEPAAAADQEEAAVPSPAPAFTDVPVEEPAVGHFPIAQQVDAAPARPRTPELQTLASKFESLVGGRLLVWTGGIALGLAGLFLVRYSIEVGLIGPAARMVIAAVFGVALLGAGELARTRLPGDPRIGQALVGAGVLVLYAAAYGAHVLYGLIGLGTAFALMAAVAAGALALSLRHGVPTAVLGLVGGFLTPLLVGDPNAGALPLLGYLALLNVAVLAVARRARRDWLVRASQLLTLLWTASLLLPVGRDALAVGLFLLVYTVAAGLTLRTPGERFPGAAASFALLQLGAVVAVDGFGSAGWAIFLGLAAAGFVLSSRSAVLARLPERALPAALLLLASQAVFATKSAHPGAVAAAMTLLFAGGAWWRLERGSARLPAAATICAGLAGPALVLRLLEEPLLSRPAWGALLALLVIVPAVLAWRLRPAARAEPPFDASLLLAGTTAAVLAGAGALDLAAPSWLPLAWMAVALAVLGGANRIGDAGLARLALMVATLGALAAAARTPMLWDTLAASLVGVPPLLAGLPSPGQAALLFAGPASIWLTVWQKMPQREAELARFAAAVAAALAALFAYILYKQLFALRTEADFVARGFAERVLLTQALFFAGWLLARRPRLQSLRPLAFALTAVAAARFAWFDVLGLNPAAVAQSVGATKFLNLIVPAYFASAFWLFEARRRAVSEKRAATFFALFVTALLAGSGLLVRQLFHGAILTGGALPRAEFYGYSLAGLLLSVALLLAGWRRADTPMRVAGLALLTAAVVKVFAVDAAALAGILRILSFLGLGIALIGMGKLYGTLLGQRSGGVKPD